MDSRFDPEISMSCLNDNSDEITFGGKAEQPAEPVKRAAEPVKRQALSVLSVISSQKPESRLSFSGLFPKSGTPVKSREDGDEEEGKPATAEVSAQPEAKRKRLESDENDWPEPPEVKKSRCRFY
jgi:hypothetical protein